MTLRPFCVTALLLVLGWRPARGDEQAAEQTPAAAQDAKDTATPAQKPEPKPEKEKRGEFAVAPFPLIDPTIGNGIAVGALYATRLNREDRVSPASVFAIGGLRTSNGTWGIAGGGKFYFKKDRYRAIAAGGLIRANYTYYGIGNGNEGIEIPISQDGNGIVVGLQVRAFEHWYVGSRYYYFKVTTGLDRESEGEAADPIREVGIKMPVAALAWHIQRDGRDHQWYPKGGTLFDSKGYYSDKSVGALFTYQDYSVSFQQFISIHKKGVLAYRGKACAVNGHAPFFALCTLGNAADLRGYPVGRYRDRRMLVGQVEYRHELWWRFGAVAFGGAGQVASTFGDLTWSNTRPGAGLGVRFALAPKNRINLRIDYSVGQGSTAWYMGVGEVF